MRVKELMTTGALPTLDPRDTLELATQVLLWGEGSHLPVVEDGAVVGICGPSELIGRTDLSVHVADVMRQPALIVGPDDEIATAAATMAAHGLNALPVVDGSMRLLGVLQGADLLGLLVARTARRSRVVSESVGAAMTRNPVTARAGDALVDAAERMRAIGIRHLPVLDGDGCVIGIVSDRDLRTVVGSADTPLDAEGMRTRVRALKVSDVMSRDPLTTTAAAALEDAGRALVEHRIGALPVVDERRRIVGMLSYVDYIRATTAP